MGLQLEPRNQSSFEQHGPWPLHDSRLQQTQRVNIGAALLQAAALPVLNECLGELSRPRKPRHHPPISGKPLAAAKPQVQISSGGTGPVFATAKSVSIPAAGAKGAASAGDATVRVPTPIHQITAGLEILSFPIKALPRQPRPDLKRRRPATDVDGFDTASLACKKQRLRREFVTSRLSQPFSAPATHIPNRECVISGDQRCLRLAAVLASRRLHNGGSGQPQAQAAQVPPPSPSSMMRRVAVINRFRLRLRTEAAERGDTDAVEMEAGVLLPQQNHAGQADDARFPLPFSHQPTAPILRIPPETPLSPVTRARIQARAAPPASPAGLRPTEPSGPPRRLSPSPRLRPLRSPELRTTRPLFDMDDAYDLDDDSVAFPTSEHESRYGDEPDDVYTDFGLIFGGEGEEADDADNYEDYLDDVDGIPWNARC